MIDIHNKDKYAIQSYNDNNPVDVMNTTLEPESNKNTDRDVSLVGNNSRKFFMMYATENEDGTTTSVAFGGVANTDGVPQFRTKQTRNIVTNSTQSMISGERR